MGVVADPVSLPTLLPFQLLLLVTTVQCSNQLLIRCLVIVFGLLLDLEIYLPAVHAVLLPATWILLRLAWMRLLDGEQ
jgi:hypothetical protein